MTQPSDDTLHSVDTKPAPTEPARDASEATGPAAANAGRPRARFDLRRVRLPRVPMPALPPLSRLRTLPPQALHLVRSVPLGGAARPAAAAAALAFALGAGFALGRAADGSSAETAAVLEQLRTASAELKGGGESILRVAGDMKAVRTVVDGLKGERDRTRSEFGARQDKAEKMSADSAGRLAKMAEQVERMEKVQRDPARVNTILERIERLEARMATAGLAPAPAVAPAAAPIPMASAPTPPPKPGTDPVHTGSLPDGRAGAAAKATDAKTAESDPRRVQIDGFVLRDIDDGVALIEGRNGRFFEVSRGMTLPGLGRVEALERRGRQWVVVTPKGFIGER